MCEFADPEMGFAIYKNFPIDIVKTLNFVNPHTKRLITEFWYKHTGQVEYEEPAQEEGWQYARLITKSSHYIDLGQVLRTVAMTVAEFMTQTSYAAQCLLERYEGSMDTLRTTYAILVFCKILLMFILSLDRASAAFAADPGDFGDELNWRDYYKRLIQATFFNMFDVPSGITDLPVLTHIKKPVQPFVSFRSKEGIRAWIIGYQSSAQYEVECGGETIAGLILKIFVEPCIAVVTIMLGLGEGFSVEVVTSLFWSIMSFYTNIINAFTLNHARQEYRHALKHDIEHLQEMLSHQGAGQDDEIQQHTQQELRVQYRQFKRFFPFRNPPEMSATLQRIVTENAVAAQATGSHSRERWYEYCLDVIGKYERSEAAELREVVQRKSTGLRAIIAKEPATTTSARAAKAPIQKLFPFPDPVSHAAPAHLELPNPAVAVAVPAPDTAFAMDMPMLQGQP